MMIRIFATGVTGFLGGDAIYALLTAHPDYEVSCLVRSTSKAMEVLKILPMVRIVQGTLDDIDILEDEASKADIVCHFANGTHELSATALAKGLSYQNDSVLSRQKFFIHVTGTGTMTYDDVVNDRFGESSSKVFNDVLGLVDVTSVPDFARARGAERVVREAGLKFPERVRTAVVSTGSAYGYGRGISKYRTTAIHELVRCTLQAGHGLQLGAGQAAWPHIFVQDLSSMILKLVEHATGTAQITHDDRPAIWGGPEGFYFMESGEHIWRELAQEIVIEASARGFIKDRTVHTITPIEAASLTAMGNYFWGCNARVKGWRARASLNWQPIGPSLSEELIQIIDVEARKLGLI